MSRRIRLVVLVLMMSMAAGCSQPVVQTPANQTGGTTPAGWTAQKSSLGLEFATPPGWSVVDDVKSQKLRIVAPGVGSGITVGTLDPSNAVDHRKQVEDAAAYAASQGISATGPMSVRLLGDQGTAISTAEGASDGRAVLTALVRSSRWSIDVIITDDPTLASEAQAILESLGLEGFEFAPRRADGSASAPPQGHPNIGAPVSPSPDDGASELPPNHPALGAGGSEE